MLNVGFMVQFTKWFQFYFAKAKIVLTVASVMDHLAMKGLPYEFLEYKFFVCKMAEQTAKLSLLQMQNYLHPHERHLREWNTI